MSIYDEHVMKTCSKCDNTYPMIRENFGSKKYNGIPRVGSWCRACCRKNTNDHAAKNRHMAIARNEKRRATQDNGNLRPYLDDLITKQDCKCYYCKADLESYAEVDHKQPVSLGGKTTEDNLAATCKYCNRSKREKPEAEYMEWLRERGII